MGIQSTSAMQTIHNDGDTRKYNKFEDRRLIEKERERTKDNNGIKKEG